MSAAQVGRVLELDSPGSSEIFESVEVLPGVPSDSREFGKGLAFGLLHVEDVDDTKSAKDSPLWFGLSLFWACVTASLPDHRREDGDAPLPFHHVALELEPLPKSCDKRCVWALRGDEKGVV